MANPQGPGSFVTEAYQVEGEAGLIAFYEKWANDYDAKMLGLGYVSAQRIARLLTNHLPDTQAEVCDVGCGTGLTCTHLHEQGYTRLDGLDLSQDMVRVAKQRGIYRELVVGDVTQPLDRASAAYDAVVSSGTFTHGHVGPEPLDEIIRILRPGGVIACTVHKDLWESHGFKDKFASLSALGIVTCLEHVQDIYYTDGEPEGWFCVYRKIA